MVRRSHFPRTIIECIAHNREPSPQELLDVAERICGDLGGLNESKMRQADAKLISIQAAYAAFGGGRRNASS